MPEEHHTARPSTRNARPYPTLKQYQTTHPRSAANHRRPRRRIRLPAIIRLPRSPIDTRINARVIGSVRPRKTDGGRGREGAAARDVDLGARLVELGLVGLVGRVQGQHLDAQQVLAVGDAGRQVEVDPAVVADEVVDAPFFARGVEAVLPDLEPVGGFSFWMVLVVTGRLTTSGRPGLRTRRCRPWRGRP